MLFLRLCGPRQLTHSSHAISVVMWIQEINSSTNTTPLFLWLQLQAIPNVLPQPYTLSLVADLSNEAISSHEADNGQQQHTVTGETPEATQTSSNIWGAVCSIIHLLCTFHYEIIV